jgi:glucose-1-phosphate cytidylyltransferase
LEGEHVKVIILAGGQGTRMNGDPEALPKPLIKIGEKPILWHLMKYYASFGFDEFIVAAGYKAQDIREYGCSQMEFDVKVVDTGFFTQTGGRIKRLASFIKGDETFMMTYANCVSDLNLKALLTFHQEQGKLATIATVHPHLDAGKAEFSGDQIIHFEAKSKDKNLWINSGFSILNRKVLDRIKDDNTSWESHLLVQLAEEGQLSGFKHEGFWQSMDTYKDKLELDELWDSGKALWKRD